MRIELSEERREQLATEVQQLFLDEFERDLSEFQAERLIDFFMSQMGPPVYNQAVQDARRYVMAKLDDLDGEVYEPEDP
ncbi:MAG: DUF2164 domain-containing protein, partial [Gemmatimonadetes bacterium]|nr:DUF2164 domain-containing protein [Gemmatimonadota bacterium]